MKHQNCNQILSLLDHDQTMQFTPKTFGVQFYIDFFGHQCGNVTTELFGTYMITPNLHTVHCCMK